MITKINDKKAIRLQVTEEGIRISIDICQIILDVLERTGKDLPSDDGGSLKQYLRKMVDDPVRDALEDKQFGIR